MMDWLEIACVVGGTALLAIAAVIIKRRRDRRVERWAFNIGVIRQPGESMGSLVHRVAQRLKIRAGFPWL